MTKRKLGISYCLVTLYVCNCTPVRVYYEMCWHGDKFQPSAHVIILVKTSNIVPIAYNGNVIPKYTYTNYRFISVNAYNKRER